MNGNRGICETVKTGLVTDELGLVSDELGLDELYPLLKDHFT